MFGGHAAVGQFNAPLTIWFPFPDAQSEGPAARKHWRPRAMPEPRNVQGTAEPVLRPGVFTLPISPLLIEVSRASLVSLPAH